MKILFAATAFIFCFNSYAKNWHAINKQNSYGSFSSKQKCEQVEGQKCFDITNKVVAIHSVVEVDNLESPIYRSPEDSTVKIDCDGPEDCLSKMAPKDEEGNLLPGPCKDDGDTPRFDESGNWLAIVGLGSSHFIWCEKVVGYHQKEILVEDPVKKAAYEAEKAQEDQVKAMAVEGEKALVVGEEAKRLMVGYMKLKNLPKAQRKQLRQDLKSIIDALDVGSIDIAIDEIKALTEDGVVVTPEAKALILGVFGKAGYDIN